jgi:hypothetical protein
MGGPDPEEHGVARRGSNALNFTGRERDVISIGRSLQRWR